MNKEKSLKDQFYESDSNWITDKNFEGLKARMEEECPGIEISKDSEFIMLRKGGRELQLHRWYTFDYAPDGQNVKGIKIIEQLIREFAKEDK
jgi:hypothetical protein